MFFDNYRITVRLAMLVGVFLVLMLAETVVEIVSLNVMQKRLEAIVGGTSIKLELAQDLRFLARNESAILRNILLHEGEAHLQNELERLRQVRQEYADKQDRLVRMSMSNGTEILLEAIMTGEKKTRPLWDEVLRLSLEGRREAGVALLLDEARQVQWQWLGSLDAMVDHQKKVAGLTAENAFSAYTRAKNILILAGIAAFIFGGFAAYIISSSIRKPLERLTRDVHRIAHGDLEVTVATGSKNEIGVLGLHINHMVRMLKKNQQELRQYHSHLENLVEQRTETLNRQREKFISVLIHDLKGPLVPILAFSKKLINRKARTREDEEKYLKTIYQSSEKLLKTVEETSKNLRNKLALQTFHPETVRLHDTLTAVIGNFLPELDSRQIVLFCNNRKWREMKTMPELTIRADPDQLKTLLENLLGNAVKYARSQIAIELERSGAGVHFTVADDGPGIPPAYHDKIFEEFFQVPGSKKGTGIGLYSVRKVVENHGGSVTVGESDAGGARFSVTLPVSDS